MKQYLNFEKNITPIFIHIIFWLSVLASLVVGVYGIIMGIDGYYGEGPLIQGILILLFGPIVSRIYCELIMVIFTISKNLQKIVDQKALDRASQDATE